MGRQKLGDRTAEQHESRLPCLQPCPSPDSAIGLDYPTHGLIGEHVQGWPFGS